MDDFMDDVPALPIRDIQSGGKVADEGQTEQRVQEITLSDMQREGYVFFTPALLVTHGLLDLDPVVQFDQTQDTTDASERVFFIESEHPFFSGLGMGLLGGQSVNWDHRIYGIVGEHWEECKSYLEATCGFSEKMYHYFRTGTQNLTIVDPTAFYGHGGTLSALPALDLTVFCVSTNKLFAWIKPAGDPPRNLPHLRVDPPRQDIKAEAEAILGPPPNPDELLKFREGHNA